MAMNLQIIMFECKYYLNKIANFHENSNNDISICTIYIAKRHIEKYKITNAQI